MDEALRRMTAVELRDLLRDVKRTRMQYGRTYRFAVPIDEARDLRDLITPTDPPSAPRERFHQFEEFQHTLVEKIEARLQLVVVAH